MTTHNEIADWLDEAAQEVSDWGAYASEYFQSKWDLPAAIKTIQDRAAHVRTLPAAATIESLQAKVAELESTLKEAYVLTDWSPDSKTAAERAAVLDRMDRYFQAKV